MGLPNLNIEFVKKAIAAIAVGAGGVVGIILRDSNSTGAHVLRSVEEIPADWSEDNKGYVERAFLGLPTKVIVYVTKSQDQEDGTAFYTEALKFFSGQRVNYLCGDPAIKADEAEKVSTWVAGKRKAGKIHPVAVLPGVTSADNEGVVNFCLVGEGSITVGEDTYTAAEYCSRIAGILAGTKLTMSATYTQLSEVTAIPDVDDDETVSTAIDAGKLVLYNNGFGIVIARAVNSLHTISQEKTEDLKKIKVVAIQDRITEDLTDTINKNYIGKYANSYDNKCLLITAIMGYLHTLEINGYLESGHSTMEINVEKQKTYLESIGIDTSDMDEQTIKEYNTGSHVFLKGHVSILDAIEDVDIVINKE